jgi:hypothetical protein
MGAIPAVATTRGLRSSAFDRHQEQMKQLLPKHLAERAKKVEPAQVEAEVLRILSAKPPPPTPPNWAVQLGMASGLLQASQQHQETDRQARELERLYMADVQQTPWFRPGSIR